MHAVALSVLSGAHLGVVPDVVDGLRAAGLTGVAVVVGGIIPERDAEILRRHGLAGVFTPADFDLAREVAADVELIRAANNL